MDLQTYLWMIALVAGSFLLIIIAAHLHMRTDSGAAAVLIWAAVILAGIVGAWFGKEAVDGYFYTTSYTAPPEMWRGALWIGIGALGALIAGAIAFGISRFPKEWGYQSPPARD